MNESPADYRGFFVHFYTNPPYNMFYAICYVSSVNESLNSDDLQTLFEQTQATKNANNISGILLHNAGNFLQYIEGEEESIKELYYKHIELDDRHHNAIVLFENRIKDPYFLEYQAGFTSVMHKNSTQKLIAYLQLLKYVDSKEMETLNNTINSFLS